MLIIDDVLDPAGFHAIAARLRRRPVRARKTAWVAARLAEPGAVVETRWNGAETTNTAQHGDWLLTALDRQKQPMTDAEGRRNIYLLKPDKFRGLYEETGRSNAHGTLCRPRGEVLALYLAGGFDILAPWGARQRADRGYLILNGDEVYGNHADTFKATYERLRPNRPA